MITLAYPLNNPTNFWSVKRRGLFTVNYESQIQIQRTRDNTMKTYTRPVEEHICNFTLSGLCDSERESGEAFFNNWNGEYIKLTSDEQTVYNILKNPIFFGGFNGWTLVQSWNLDGPLASYVGIAGGSLIQADSEMATTIISGEEYVVGLEVVTGPIEIYLQSDTPQATFEMAGKYTQTITAGSDNNDFHIYAPGSFTIPSIAKLKYPSLEPIDPPDTFFKKYALVLEADTVEFNRKSNDNHDFDVVCLRRPIDAGL